MFCCSSACALGSRLERPHRRRPARRCCHWSLLVPVAPANGCGCVSLALLGNLEGAVVDVRGHLPEKEDEGDARNGLRAEDDGGEEGEDEEHGVSGCGGECGCVGGCSPASVLRGLLKASAGRTETLAAQGEDEPSCPV